MIKPAIALTVGVGCHDGGAALNHAVQCGFMLASTQPPQRRELVRSLTLIPAASLIIANVIGTGVFIKARVMTCNVETPGMVLLVWVAAGVLTLAGALVYAELSAMMPKAGGEYNFLGAAYGRLPAFLFAWTRIIAIAASGAAVAMAFTIFLNDLLGGTLSKPLLRLIPAAVIIVATLLNLMPAKSSAWVATMLTLVKIALVAGIGIGAFLLAEGSFGHFTQNSTGGTCEDVPESARGGVAGFGAAMLGALWAYNGWNGVGYLGGEIKDPGRTLPRALIGGTLLIIVLYVLVNAAYFYVLTPVEVASVSAGSSVAREVAVRSFGSGAAGLMAAGLMISAYGTLHTGSLWAPRLPYALARDGLLPRALGYLTVRGVPVVAVLACGALACALTFTGSFDVITDIYVFILWVFYGLTCAAVFVLRRKFPDVHRPFRVWFYPVMPLLFLAVTAFLLVNTLMTTPGRALAGLGMIVLGLPVYWYFAPRAGPAKQVDWFGR